MKRTGVMGCVLLGGILAAGTGQAQVVQSPQEPGAAGRIENGISTAGKYQNYIYGVVKKIGKDEIVLDKTRFGDNQPFKLEHGTKFVRNGKNSSLAEVKIGDMAWVDAKTKKKSEEMIAKKVITGVVATGISQ